MLYPLIRSLLFNFSPEKVHYFSMNLLRGACNIGPVRTLVSAGFQYRNPKLEKKVFGLTFNNPVGLGAGFDKNALYLQELEALGFGFVEIGTVTPLSQDGNELPRLFRLPADKALVNRMGFNNQGVNAVAARLAQWQQANAGKPNRMIIGGNIGKNKVTPNEDAWKDYERCFTALFDYVDYFVVNVSSPNTPGLRELQEKDSLRKILAHLQTLNQAQAAPKPLLLKIAPDLTDAQLDDIIDLAFEVKLDGLVATNTTISRDGLQTPANNIAAIGVGGLSGKPVQQRSTEVLQYLTRGLQGKIPVIASGGIFTGADAAEKFRSGAALVQVWTGFIYEGPAIVKHISQYLVERREIGESQ